jgi:uncharacterized protein (DUF433 family)
MNWGDYKVEQILEKYSNTLERNKKSIGFHSTQDGNLEITKEQFQKKIFVSPNNNLKNIGNKGLITHKVEYNRYHQNEDRMVSMFGRKYLEKMIIEDKNVKIDPNVMGGIPVITGTRIQVSLILACLRDEMTIEEICEDYSLSPQTVKEVLNFVIKVLDKPFTEE